MSSCKRHGKKWTISELLKLEKEIDQQMSIKEIAALHKRTERAILFKIYDQQINNCPSKEEPEISSLFYMLFCNEE